MKNIVIIDDDNILKLLYDISQSGRAVLMATHDYTQMTTYGNRTLTCEGGKVLDSKVEPAPKPPLQENDWAC